MGVFGDTLRQARAHKGVTLREAEVSTRINRHWLLALEEEHFDQLPALIYQRGIVRNYANFLNLDQAKLLALFAESRGDRPSDAQAVLSPPTTVSPTGSFVPNFAVIAFIVVAMGAVFAWGYSAYFNTDPAGPGGAGSVPTATALNDEERFIATSTALPVTNTPVASAPTATKEATSSGGRVQIAYPTATLTPESITLDGSEEDDGEVIDEGAGESTEADIGAGESISFSFYTESDIDLLIVIDNVVVWNSPLGAQQSTGYLSGSTFVVSLSGAEYITVIDGSGDAIDIAKTEFTLP